MNLYRFLPLVFCVLMNSCLVESGEKNTSVTPQNKRGLTSEITFLNKGHEIIYKMVNKVGSIDDLRGMHDVVYTYEYEAIGGKKDIVTEKYIFDGELSYGKYLVHERTFSNLSGNIEQGFDGEEYWLKVDGKVEEDEKLLKRVAFNRSTNYFWFAMFQKLLDPYLTYEYMGEKNIEGSVYEVIKVDYISTSKEVKDMYQVYINKDTWLVDQFLFTVADFGVLEEPYLMKLEYESVDGIMIPSSRRYQKSTWEAEESDNPWVRVNWSNIKFDNGLKVADFKK